MYSIRGEFRQFCFDRAVLTFGTALEAELDNVTGKTDKIKNQRRAQLLDRWLGRELKFRNPAGPTTGNPSSTAAPKDDVEKEFVMQGDGTEMPRE